MEVLPLLIIISLGVIALAVWIFFRMSDSGQFDDTEGPARRILMDDDRPPQDPQSTSPAKDRAIDKK
jgi:cbb3-type cytochrome oxidase maturation protein